MACYGRPTLPREIAYPDSPLLRGLEWTAPARHYPGSGSDMHWGPWYLVHYDNSWEDDDVAYLPQIPSKWISSDGLQGVTVYCGDYSIIPKPASHQLLSGFITRPFRLLLR